MKKSFIYIFMLSCLYACEKDTQIEEINSQVAAAPVATKSLTARTVGVPAVVVPNANTITFDVDNTADSKFGQIGFLSSVGLTNPADDEILPLKPYWWRTGRNYTSTNMPNSFDLYSRLQGLGVQRQLLIVSDYRNTAPTNTIYNAGGLGVLADSLYVRAAREGKQFDWDLYNEPNTLMKAALAQDGNIDSFMNTYWIPAYRAIKARNPNAKIHGPSIFAVETEDSDLMYKFFDAAIASNTMPDFVNWHFQAGTNIPDGQNAYVTAMKNYLSARSVTVEGFVCGESMRSGEERNTSPGNHVGIFLAAEVFKIPQIHAAWTANPVYGVETSKQPVLDGLLANTDGTGRRGVWWTYEFYGRMTGVRVKCSNSGIGISTLYGLAFRDDSKKEIRLIVGAKDLNTIGNQTDKSILVGNLNVIPGFVNQNQKVHIRAWHNLQTQGAVTGYGATNLEKVIDADYDVSSANGGILIQNPTINKLAALLVEITAIN